MKDLVLCCDENRYELCISDDSDWALFNSIAGLLEHELGGTWTEKINGSDERYWDLKVGNIVLTLHLQHYLGIMLFPGSDESDKLGAKVLIDKAHELLTTYGPHA